MVVILLMKVMKSLSVAVGDLLDIPCMVFHVCIVPVILVCVKILLLYVFFVFSYVGRYLLI